MCLCVVIIAIICKINLKELYFEFIYKLHLKLLIIVKNYVDYNNSGGISVEVAKQKLVARLKDITDKLKFLPL